MRLTGSVRGLCSVLLFALLSVQGQLAAAEGPIVVNDSLAANLPAGAIATLEFANLEPQIERIENSATLKTLLESPLWQDALKQESLRKAMVGKALAEGQLGMTLWQFAKTFLGDRSIVGLYAPSAPEKQPEGVILIRVKDAKSLEKLWERLSPLLPLAGQNLKVSDDDAGGRRITASDGHLIVIRDRWIVISRAKSLVDQTMKNLEVEQPVDAGLRGTPAWKQMAAQLGTDHEVQLCFSIEALNALAGHRIIPTKLENGVVSLLFGGYLELAANSPYVGSTIDIHPDHFQWRTTVAGDSRQLDAAHRPFVLDTRPIPRAAVPRVNDPFIGFSLTRDFAGWYRNREALLAAKLIPAFDKFETGFATYLPGLDFGDQILPMLGQRLTVVTAPQSFTHLKGKPGVQLPGLAILLDLAKPDEANDLLNLVFQTLIGLSNFQALKEGRQQFVITSESYHDTQISFAKFVKQPEADTLPISANIQPASARVGNHFIITTSVAMCRQLIDTLQSEPASAAPPFVAAAAPIEPVRDIYLDVSPTAAADLLELNAAVIHAKSLQQGKSAERSTVELNALVKILRQLAVVTFTSTRHADHWELEFRGGWK